MVLSTFIHFGPSIKDLHPNLLEISIFSITKYKKCEGCDAEGGAYFFPANLKLFMVVLIKNA